MWSLLGRYTNMKWEAEASPLGLHICNKTMKSKQIQIVIKNTKHWRERDLNDGSRGERESGMGEGIGENELPVWEIRLDSALQALQAHFFFHFFFFTFIRNSQEAEPLRSLHDFYFYFFDWTGWDCLRIRNLWKN